MRSRFEFRAADIGDLPHRDDVLLIDVDLRMRICQSEESRAGCGNHVELLPTKVFVG